MQSNVLIHNNARTCIADFGPSTLLTQLGGSTFETSFQRITPKVILTPQNDLYSFGGIMSQVLTGEMLYH
ncbi:hypothetical protein BS17DRAFT_789279 [Gyrodon lividus]|nr:hypothetical protein BS17DRAFT_789279 [Gyrodon lividus]